VNSSGAWGEKAIMIFIYFFAIASIHLFVCVCVCVCVCVGGCVGVCTQRLVWATAPCDLSKQSIASKEATPCTISMHT